MSYCRFGGGSDVYMYPTGSFLGKPTIVCCMCRLLGGDSDTECLGPAEALFHLHQHLAVGDRVPQHAIDRLDREAAADGGREKKR